MKRVVAAFVYVCSVAVVTPARATPSDEAPTAEQAVALLRAHADEVRAGHLAKVIDLYDTRAIAEGAYGPLLLKASAEERQEVLDVFAQGWIHAFDPAANWMLPRATVDDFKSEPLPGGRMLATLHWTDPTEKTSGRWGLVFANVAGRLRAVDLLATDDPRRFATGILREERERVLEGRPLSEFLREFLRVPYPDSVVPADAPTDWAGPDVLALPVEVPVVDDAKADGWAPPDRPARIVLHAEAGGRVHGRLAAGRAGSGARVRTGDLIDPLSLAVLLQDVRASKATMSEYDEVLVRVDRRTSWDGVRTLVRALRAAGATRIAFGVTLAAAQGRARFGQVGLWPEAVSAVAPTSERAERSEGPKVLTSPPPTATPLDVRIARVVAGGASATTQVFVANDAPRSWPDAPAADRIAAFSRVEAALRAHAEGRGVVRFRLIVAAGAVEAPSAGEVIPLLALLQRVAGTTVDVEDFPFPGADGAEGLAWTIPAGWTLGAPRLMLLAALTPEGTKSTSCSVMMLAGGGGGWADNADRYRRQLGQPPLTDEERAQVPRLQVLETSARVLTVRGTSQNPPGGPPINDAMLVAVLCELPDCIVIVKMVGPRAEVESALPKFEQFCRSLRRR